MRFSTILSVLVTSKGGEVAAYGPWGGSSGGPLNGLGPSCLSDCWNDLGGLNWQNGITALCQNSTAVDSINSCVSSSSCSNDDKQGTYQVLAQVCANAGSPITASPEATYSATSGGTSYPTGTGSWASYASQWATVTGKPSGWGPGSGYGPFGAGAAANGYGPWGSSGWTSGPWTSWWGTSGCPPSTWSGWTSASWATNAPWTSWTACAASTTATSVVTATVTTGSSTVVQTSTSYAVRVAEAVSTSGSSTSSAAAAAAAVTAGSMAYHGAGVGALAAALMVL